MQKAYSMIPFGMSGIEAIVKASDSPGSRQVELYDLQYNTIGSPIPLEIAALSIKTPANERWPSADKWRYTSSDGGLTVTINPLRYLKNGLVDTSINYGIPVAFHLESCDMEKEFTTMDRNYVDFLLDDGPLGFYDHDGRLGINNDLCDKRFYGMAVPTLSVAFGTGSRELRALECEYLYYGNMVHVLPYTFNTASVLAQEEYREQIVDILSYAVDTDKPLVMKVAGGVLQVETALRYRYRNGVQHAVPNSRETSVTWSGAEMHFIIDRAFVAAIPLGVMHAQKERAILM